MTDPQTILEQRFQTALDKNFRGYTSEQLDEFGSFVGVKFAAKTPSDKKISELLAACNRTQEYAPEPMPEEHEQKVSDVLPPYNLILERGVWGGRYHNIMLFRPHDADAKEAGMIFTVNNNWVPVRYDPEVTRIPEPHMLAMKDCEEAKGEIVRQMDDQGFVNVHTRINRSRKYKFSYEGPDENTKDRAGSIQEFYKRKGREWFDKLSHAQLREIMAYMMKNTRDKQDRPLDGEMIRAILNEEFFPPKSAAA